MLLYIHFKTDSWSLPWKSYVLILRVFWFRKSGLILQKTGIKELEATTRDIPDYDVLMTQRLNILKQHGLGLNDIQAVIADMGPLPGAKEFVEWVRTHFQLIILSDTFYEFAHPLMQQLGWPTIFCHKLETDEKG